MPDPIKLAIHGASGRMGRALFAAIDVTPHAMAVAALVGAESSVMGEAVPPLPGGQAPALAFSSALTARADVLIDFSTATAFDAALELALTRRMALVSGTTGLSELQRVALTHAATRIPVLWAANFSLGVAALLRLVRQAALALPAWECEILEAHHRHKRDAPSGTALSLASVVAGARSQPPSPYATYGRRDDAGARVSSEIGFAVVRGGDVVGEHTVFLLGDGERLELTHRAQSRDIFAAGALRAAMWLAGRAPGTYSMDDLLTPATDSHRHR